MLPPLPSFLPSRPADVQEPDLTVYPDILTSTPGASSSRLGPNHPANSKCSICSQEPKYTCPRCSARTCSLPCSKAHKSNTGCDGTRDPAKFVTLTEFGQGDWGGDYAYLESGRRKIADWGKDLPATPSHASHGTRGGRGGHERGQGGKKRGPPKLEGLRRELEARGVEVEFMPEGMGRRKLNQSTWNPKTKKLHLTIQLSIPEFLLASGTDSGSVPKNEAGMGQGMKTINHLRVLYASHSTYSTNAETLPTLSSLLPALPEAVVLVLPFHPSYDTPTPIDILLRHPRPRLFFPPLNLDTTLEEAFRGMSWVEFPVLTVVPQSEWEERLEKGTVAVVPVRIVEETRGEKRQREGDGVAELMPPQEPVGVKRVREEVQGGLMGLGGYESDESDGEGPGDEQGSGSGDGKCDDSEMVITEEDVRVLHALGAAAAADME